MKKIILPIVIGMVISSRTPCLAGEIARSGPAKVSLIEVYSSEGCSSCVSAWDWLARLEDTNGLWTSFVPVDFHVEYWDYLGWKDKLANPVFTDRQRQYAARWGIDSIYTPGFVLDGREWRLWHSDPLPGLKPGNPAGTLTVHAEADNRYKAVFEPEKEGKGFTAHFVLLGSNYVSEVERGENSGRQLKHHFAAVDYQKAEMTSRDDGKFEAQGILKFPPFIRDAKKGIAVFITARDSLNPVQAAGAYLSAYAENHGLAR